MQEIEFTEAEAWTIYQRAETESEHPGAAYELSRGFADIFKAMLVLEAVKKAVRSYLPGAIVNQGIDRDIRYREDRDAHYLRIGDQLVVVRILNDDRLFLMRQSEYKNGVYRAVDASYKNVSPDLYILTQPDFKDVPENVSSEMAFSYYWKQNGKPLSVKMLGGFTKDDLLIKAGKAKKGALFTRQNLLEIAHAYGKEAGHEAGAREKALNYDSFVIDREDESFLQPLSAFFDLWKGWSGISEEVYAPMRTYLMDLSAYAGALKEMGSEEVPAVSKQALVIATMHDLRLVHQHNDWQTAANKASGQKMYVTLAGDPVELKGQNAVLFIDPDVVKGEADIYEVPADKSDIGVEDLRDKFAPKYVLDLKEGWARAVVKTPE